MAFNGSGTYVRSFTWATDKANAVAVTATRFDTEDDGFATGLSTCICKDGQTTVTARIPFALGIGIGTGTVSLPAINFTADTNTGVYSAGADNIAIACGGAKVLDISTTGLGVTGGVTVSGGLTVSGTAAVVGLSTLGSLTVSGGATTLSGTLTLLGIGTTASAANLFQDGATGAVSRSTSSAKYKRDIEDIEFSEALRIVYGARPIKHRSRAPSDDPDRQYLGLIAEEMAEVDPRLVHYRDGRPDGVQYERVNIALLAVVKKLAQGANL